MVLNYEKKKQLKRWLGCWGKEKAVGLIASVAWDGRLRDQRLTERLRDHALSPPCDAVSMATTVSWVTPINVTMTSSPVVRATLQMVHKA